MNIKINWEHLAATFMIGLLAVTGLYLLQLGESLLAAMVAVGLVGFSYFYRQERKEIEL